MARKKGKSASNIWLTDQLTKSSFLHQKMHQYGLIEVADEIEKLKGERLDWADKEGLGISAGAWNKVIHRGIKPVRVFAHPEILSTLPRAVSYYRGLAMVSQKSMGRIRLATNTHEREMAPRPPETGKASTLAKRFNELISALLETDENINAREFDIWRGITAGVQADGSWRNIKGDKAEELIRTLVSNRLKSRRLIKSSNDENTEFVLNDGRHVSFASEPDIKMTKQGLILKAVEVKGGIDSAGVLERLGAAIKSFSRVKKDHPSAKTILVMYKSAMTQRAENDIASNRSAIDFFMQIEDVLETEEANNRFFGLLDI